MCDFSRKEKPPDPGAEGAGGVWLRGAPGAYAPVRLLAMPSARVPPL